MSARRRSTKASSTLPVPPPQITLDPEQQIKFDQELAWCIGNIHLTLSTENDTKKHADYEKALRALQNSTVSLIKKRGLMANLCGDYRAKMKKEESSVKTKDLAKMVQSDQNSLKKLAKKSKFVRKSTTKSQTNEKPEKEICDQLKGLNIDEDKNAVKIPTIFKMTAGNESFKFNFVS